MLINHVAKILHSRLKEETLGQIQSYSRISSTELRFCKCSSVDPPVTRMSSM